MFAEPASCPAEGRANTYAACAVATEPVVFRVWTSTSVDYTEMTLAENKGGTSTFHTYYDAHELVATLKNVPTLRWIVMEKTVGDASPEFVEAVSRQDADPESWKQDRPRRKQR